MAKRKRKPPKYSIGTKVKHIVKNKWGTVVDVFESDDTKKLIEYRYYVKHSGYVWSIPESGLEQSCKQAQTSNQKLIRAEIIKGSVG